MNWITTNIRFPEDLYMELKMEAARERKSIAQLFRETAEKIIYKQEMGRKKKASVLMAKMKKVARENAKILKGVNLTKALIEMRYEQ